MTAQFVRTPAERAHGTAAMHMSRRLAGLLLADHVRNAGSRLAIPLPATADPGGRDR